MSHNPEKYRAWYENNRERVIARAVEYRRRHPEKVKEYQKTFRERAKEKIAQYQRRWKRSNPEKVAQQKRRASLKKFGLTPEAVAKLAKEQGNCCAVCQDVAVLVVDHEHATGRFRGLLCNRCNTGIGLFRDDVSIFERAIAYVKAKGE